MQIVVGDQLWLLLASFLCGIFLSAVYDFIRVTRLLYGIPYAQVKLPDARELDLPLVGKSRRIPRKRRLSVGIFVFLGDVFFSVFAACALLLVFFNYASGQVRLLALLSAFCGFLLCHYTAGAIIIRLFGWVRFGLCVTLRYIGWFLFFPIRCAVLPALRWIGNIFAGVFRMLSGLLRTGRQTRRLLRDMTRGCYGAGSAFGKPRRMGK